MVDLWRDFWIRETGTGQQVAKLHERYTIMMMMMMTIHWPVTLRNIHVSWANYPTTRHIAEELNLQQHLCENLSRFTVLYCLHSWTLKWQLCRE